MDSSYLIQHAPIPLRPDGRRYPPVRPRALTRSADQAKARAERPAADSSAPRLRWSWVIAAIVSAAAVGSVIIAALS